MRKTFFIAFIGITTLLGGLFGCNRAKTPSTEERIAKVWTARVVEYNNQTVYTRGGTANVQNYANFRLDLSTPGTVRYREFDGNEFVGKYNLPSSNVLRLTELNPAPTGVTNGTIEFNITSLSDTELQLTRTTPSQKTGNTVNDYVLSNP